MQEYTSTVTIIFGGNNIDANSEDEYRLKLKDNFMETFGILVSDDEITDIQRLRVYNPKKGN
jgi:intein-encoded DNA endonuclease-like protein|tara:strand:+ start:4119 stop:4304 length:186 start_codon:yes stop_codon:yes gene_type:complete